jgi:hypothetical protein
MLVESGITRNLLERWSSQTIDTTQTEPPTKPAWAVEMELTPAGSGVFENEPVTRTDVIREEDYEPEMIPIRETRQTRAMWSQLEREESVDQGETRTRDVRLR